MVHAGTKGISVHFRYHYRFDGASREMPPGAWPRNTLNSILKKFDETKPRIELGRDPAGPKRVVVEKAMLKQAPVEQRKQEPVDRETRTSFSARLRSLRDMRGVPVPDLEQTR
jgi:hypothetical protein